MDIEDFDLADHQEYLLPSPDGYSAYSGTHSVHDRSTVDDITPERIARIDVSYLARGDHAAKDIVLLVELTDGSWATCMAWCDTTGWGCQDSVEWKWAKTRDDAITYGLDQEARTKLGLPLPHIHSGDVGLGSPGHVAADCPGCTTDDEREHARRADR